MNKSICLDLHGVITANPEFFAMLTRSLKKDGWAIHIATGSHIKEQGIEEQLKEYGVVYTNLFSISDHHRNNKTEGMWYDEKGDPWVSDEDWDKTKAEYCKENCIAFCIDDTARYANHFETPFGYMSIQIHKDKPNKYLSLIIDMFKRRNIKSNWKLFELWVDKHLGYYLNNPFKQGKEHRNRNYK